TAVRRSIADAGESGSDGGGSEASFIFGSGAGTGVTRGIEPVVSSGSTAAMRGRDSGSGTGSASAVTTDGATTGGTTSGGGATTGAASDRWIVGRGRGVGTRTRGVGAAGFGVRSGARGAAEATGARSISPSIVCGSVSGAVPKPLAGPECTAERIMERCQAPSAALSGAVGASRRDRLGVLKETARVHTDATASETASTA